MSTRKPTFGTLRSTVDFKAAANDDLTFPFIAFSLGSRQQRIPKFSVSTVVDFDTGGAAATAPDILGSYVSIVMCKELTFNALATAAGLTVAGWPGGGNQNQYFAQGTLTVTTPFLNNIFTNFMNTFWPAARVWNAICPAPNFYYYEDIKLFADAGDQWLILLTAPIIYNFTATTAGTATAELAYTSLILES